MNIFCIIFLITLFFVLDINIKKIKKMGKNTKLNEFTNNFPENIEICKSILKNLDNESVTIEENKDSKISLYIVQTNKIVIANIRDNYMRIQTIAHECIHSIQSKKIQWFNFIYTNIYILYFVISIILTLFGIIKNQMFFALILALAGTVHYFIRAMLETDAMIKARYVAKDYIEENNLCSKEECEEIISQYDKMNEQGIKLVNYDVLLKDFIKVIIYCIICIFI